MEKSIWKRIKHALLWLIIKVHWTFWVSDEKDLYNIDIRSFPLSMIWLIYFPFFISFFTSGMFDIWPVMNKCTVVAKRELFFAWPFGLAAWLCGLIFINRMQSDASRKKLTDSATSIKNKKIKMWIFPEGTRRNTGQMHSFKKGAFHVAIDAQLPILPVVFSSYRSFLDDNQRQFNSGHVIITTLPPIQTAGLTKIDLDHLMQHTYDVMNKEFLLTTKEVFDELETTTAARAIHKSTSPSTATAFGVRNTNSVVFGNGSRHCLIDDDNNQFSHQYATLIQNHNHRVNAPPTAN